MGLCTRGAGVSRREQAAVQVHVRACVAACICSVRTCVRACVRACVRTCARETFWQVHSFGPAGSSGIAMCPCRSHTRNAMCSTCADKYTQARCLHACVAACVIVRVR
eukprot:389704-Pleurochrysis_carterae.AAC.1